MMHAHVLTTLVTDNAHGRPSQSRLSVDDTINTPGSPRFYVRRPTPASDNFNFSKDAFSAITCLRAFRPHFQSTCHRLIRRPLFRIWSGVIAIPLPSAVSRFNNSRLSPHQFNRIIDSATSLISVFLSSVTLSQLPTTS